MKRSPSRRAYSYIRFSNPQQAEGGTLVRQTRDSQAYCEKKGLTLDDVLTLHDLGVSAFRGDNVRDGALAGFLEACRMGRVQRGSVLIVESLDRLSRDQIRPALQLFLALQDFGITIVTLQPEREYLPDNHDALSLIEPLIVFARAHEESLMKSYRRRDGWQQAREKARQGGGPMMKTCPAWLTVTPAGFKVKPEAAAAVREIYAMACNGLGVQRITAQLTNRKVPSLGNRGKWVKTYVYRILTNPAAMGTYQPNRQEGKKVVPDGPPIPGHYPAVVTEAEWQEAQAAVMSRDGGFKKGARGSPAAGRKGKHQEEANLFTGLLHCARSRERLHITHGWGRKGTHGPRTDYAYLTPSLETGGATGGRFRYDAFEREVLSLLSELQPSDICENGKPTNGTEAEIARLSGRLLDIDSRLERAKQRARTDQDFDAFLDLIQDLQTERKDTSARLAELRREQEGRPSSALGEAKTLIGILAQATPQELPELRRRLKTRLRLLVTEIWTLIVPVGRDRLCAVQMFFRSGRRREYVILHRPGKSYGPGREEASSKAWALANVAGAIKIDLRKRGDAKKLDAALSAIDPDELAELE